MSTTKHSHPSKTALVVPHTHWDREWRYPIWQNRTLLVRFMRQLLELLESGSDYHSFVLDGQVVAVDDFLEMCPEDLPRVRRLVGEGKLRIGPWYTLPDLYPLDGECLIRNLLKGRRRATELGGCMDIGYNSFGWGQIAQFPQIYAGFGINFAVAAKRVSKERAPHCEFLWEAPDGTRMLTTRLGKDARANGFFQMYIPVRHGIAYMDNEYRWQWGVTGSAIHSAVPELCHQDYFRLDSADGYHRDKVRDAFNAAWDAMDETLAPNLRLIMTGSDFTSALPALPKMIADANAEWPDVEIRMDTLEGYAQRLREALTEVSVPVVRGELRDGPSFACSGNALATRIYLKQRNKEVENLLLRRTEPMAAMMRMLGVDWSEAALHKAWDFLLKSHPHDSINGVTQDKTAEDTLYRLEQAGELSQVVFADGAAELVRRLDCGELAAESVCILLINTRPSAVREVLELCVDTPREENVWMPEVRELDGRVCAVQHSSRRELSCPVDDPEARPWPFAFDRHRIHVDSGDVPAGGYKVLQVVPGVRFDRRTEWWPAMREMTAPSIGESPFIMQNEFLKVEVSADGTFTLTDKVRNRSFPGLHWFEDSGDVGDYWAYYPPYQNRILSSRGGSAKVWLEDNGPLTAAIGILVTMEVPRYASIAERGINGESSRSDECVSLSITTRLTLRKGARRLDVRTSVDNRARDHRLRLMLPTGIDAQRVDSAGHFNVDSRARMHPGEEGNACWPEMRTLPQQMFVDVSDGKVGLAVVNRSFTEYELCDDSASTLAITLLRSVRNRICTEFRSSGNFPQQEGGQCLRVLDYHYGIYPHMGDWEKGNVYTEAMALNNPLAAMQFSPVLSGAKEQPLQASLIEIDSEKLVLSALKKSEERDSLILRVFNPTASTVEAEIFVAARMTQVWVVNLDEQRQREHGFNGDRIHVRVERGRILTLELEISPRNDA